MYEFELLCHAIFIEATKLIYHAAGNTFTDPDIAIDDPYQVALCFSIGTTHISNFRIRSKIQSTLGLESRVIIFDRDLSIKCRKVHDKSSENRIGRISTS